MPEHIFGHGKSKFWQGIAGVESQPLGVPGMVPCQASQPLIDWLLVHSGLLIWSIDCLIDDSIYILNHEFSLSLRKISEWKNSKKKIQKKELKLGRVLTFLSSQSSNQSNRRLIKHSINHRSIACCCYPLLIVLLTWWMCHSWSFELPYMKAFFSDAGRCPESFRNTKFLRGRIMWFYQNVTIRTMEHHQSQSIHQFLCNLSFPFFPLGYGDKTLEFIWVFTGIHSSAWLMSLVSFLVSQLLFSWSYSAFCGFFSRPACSFVMIKKISGSLFLFRFFVSSTVFCWFIYFENVHSRHETLLAKNLLTRNKGSCLMSTHWNTVWSHRQSQGAFPVFLYSVAWLRIERVLQSVLL